jgi:predicted ATPase
VHTGWVERRGNHYFGSPLFRCARLQSLGYGEQTLLTDVTANLVRDRLPDGASLRDLGTHRLKDLNEPERVYMLVHPDLRDAFPPPKSVDLHPNNLPTQLTGMIGRDEDVIRVSDLVLHRRLVTLLGPGGVGKTRLALATAANLIDHFPDGVFFVDLAPYREAGDVALATAGALGVRATPLMTTADALAAWLARRTMLVVLDNVEQIPGVGRALLDLLQAGEHVRLLVTSRSPVRVRGEERYVVEPLATGGTRTNDGLPSDAVQLFVERARQVLGRDPGDDDLPSIAAICRRVDGLPLGIELAAARTNVYEPSQILARLERRLPILVAGTDDLPARQQTLRATIAWSHDLLTLDHQRLLASSTVFPGGWTMDAWESVCAATPEAASLLVDAGLVRRREGRFGMLDTIREFAAERFSELPPGEQEALRDRHADWYGTWAADPDFGPPHRNVEDVERLRVVDAERANLSVACDRLATRDDRSLLRAVVFRLWLYWLTNGLLREGERWAAASLQGSIGPDPEDAAWLNTVLGEFPRFAGDLPRALQLKQRAIALARVAGDVKGEAATHLTSHRSTAFSATTRGPWRPPSGRSTSGGRSAVRVGSRTRCRHWPRRTCGQAISKRPRRRTPVRSRSTSMTGSSACSP